MLRFIRELFLVILGKLGQTNPGHQGHTFHFGEIVKHLVFSLRVEKVSVRETLLQSKVQPGSSMSRSLKESVFPMQKARGVLFLSVASDGAVYCQSRICP